MVLGLRPMRPEERIYPYRQSSQIAGQTGSVGYLQGHVGEHGNDFNQTWHDIWKSYKPEDFQTELDAVIHDLRSEEYGILRSRRDMEEYAAKNAEGTFPEKGIMECGFRADTERNAYLIRCIPSKGSFDIYCYVAEHLDRHMGNAGQGIRFIEPDYREKFRIPDGGKIVIKTAWDRRERVCRYIDEYHTQVGSQLYHICQFAELMHKNGATYEPKPEEAQQKEQQRKRRNREQGR